MKHTSKLDSCDINVATGKARSLNAYRMRGVSRVTKLGLLASCCFGLGMSVFSGTAVLAQEVADAQSEQRASGNMGFEEIVVTARKRSETLSDIPISISVLTERSLERMGAKDFTDLLGTVPSLSAVQQGAGRTVIIMRGVSTGAIRNDKPQNKEVVGLYIDDIPVSVNGYNPESVLFDLERVEVLRGPQGTLYGAGSMNGTIRLITKKPNASEIESKAEGDVSFTRDGGLNYGMKGMVNVPLVEDKLALRISATHSREEGYIDNINTGEDNVNDSVTTGARMALRWEPSESLTLDASFMYEKSDTAEDPIEQNTPFATDQNGRQAGSRSYGNLTLGGFDSNMKLYNFTATYDFEFAELVASSSYMDRSSENRLSLEYITAKLGASPAALAGIDHTQSTLYDGTDITDFSQEIRLASTSGSNLQWIVGGYYNQRDRYFLQDAVIPGFDLYAAPDIGIDDSLAFGAPVIDKVFYGDQDITQKQFAVFGEVYYTYEPVTITAGLRWFDWQQEFTAFSSGFLNGGVTRIPNSGTGVETAKANGFNPKVNVSVDVTDNSLFYVQAAKGFRFGGVNDPVPTVGCENALASLDLTRAPATFDEDTNWNYEAGLKGDFLEKRLNASVTYFYVKWSNIQSTRSLNGLGGDNCPFSYTDNSGSLVSKGVELETTAYVTDNLKVNLGATFTSSELAEDAPNFSALKGDRAPYVPDFSMNVSVEYNFEISDQATGYIWANVQHNGSRDIMFNKRSANFRMLNSYQMVNLRLGVDWDSLEISLYASNLLDSQAATFVGRPGFVSPGYTYNLRPRTIGLNVRTAF